MKPPLWVVTAAGSVGTSPLSSMKRDGSVAKPPFSPAKRAGTCSIRALSATTSLFSAERADRIPCTRAPDTRNGALCSRPSTPDGREATFHASTARLSRTRAVRTLDQRVSLSSRRVSSPSQRVSSSSKRVSRPTSRSDSDPVPSGLDSSASTLRAVASLPVAHRPPVATFAR